jgi:LysM repeat protein
MRYLVVGLILLCSLGTNAQETVEDVVMQYQDGKLYLVHVAEAGNTLYGMQTVYGVPVEQIVKANPGSEKGLKVGTTYLIPQGATTIKAKNGTTLVKHVVVKGETLYALSKKYGSDINEVNTINPEAASGLKLGQVLYFPTTAKPVTTAPVVKEQAETETIKTVVQFSDSTVNYVVKKGETLYTIAKRYMVSATDLQKFNDLKSTNLTPGSTLKIPIKKEKIDQVPIREIQEVDEPKVDKEIMFTKKSEYNIVVLLPFGLDRTLGAGLKNLATEYYMGMMLAVDSLEKQGIKATVNVVDFPIDSAEIILALKKPEIKSADLIIGPLMPQAADLVGSFCKTNKIRMVCPSSVNSSILKDNPYVYCAVASEITQQHILAKYTAENFKNAQIVLVNLDPKKDADLYQAYRTKYMELAAKNGAPKIIEVKLADFGSMIRKNGNTVFVVPSTNEANVVKFMLALHKLRSKAGEGNITVLGTKDWAGFDELTGYYKTTYDVQWCTASDLNYSDQKTEDLLRVYRSAYKSDMNKVAVQGYDIMRYFVPYLLMDKSNEKCLIQNAFDMNQVAPNSGFENKQCFVVEHDEYKLVRKGIYHE